MREREWFVPADARARPSLCPLDPRLGLIRVERVPQRQMSRRAHSLAGRRKRETRVRVEESQRERGGEAHPPVLHHHCAPHRPSIPHQQSTPAASTRPATSGPRPTARRPRSASRTTRRSAHCCRWRRAAAARAAADEPALTTPSILTTTTTTTPPTGGAGRRRVRRAPRGRRHRHQGRDLWRRRVGQGESGGAERRRTALSLFPANPRPRRFALTQKPPRPSLFPLNKNTPNQHRPPRTSTPPSAARSSRSTAPWPTSPPRSTASRTLAGG